MPDTSEMSDRAITLWLRRRYLMRRRAGLALDGAGAYLMYYLVAARGRVTLLTGIILVVWLISFSINSGRVAILSYILEGETELNKLDMERLDGYEKKMRARMLGGSDASH